MGPYIPAVTRRDGEVEAVEVEAVEVEAVEVAAGPLFVVDGTRRGTLDTALPICDCASYVPCMVRGQDICDADLPPVLAERIDALATVHLHPAFVAMNSAGRVTGHGGALIDYGLVGLKIGDLAVEHLPILAGLEPWSAEIFPWVLHAEGRYMDVHILPVENGHVYVLCVASQLAQDLRVQLQQTGNAIALRQQQQQQVLESFVGRYVVDELLEHRLRLRAEGERRVLTLMFCDIRGFTPFAEQHSPSAVFEVLGEYMHGMLRPILDHGGWLDKIAGDGVFGVFGLDPTIDARPARAVAAGLQQLRDVAALNRERHARGSPTLGIGIGVSTGPVALGLLGLQERKSFAIIGHHVNLAARLQSSAGPGELLIDASTHATLPAELQVFEPRLLTLKGISDPVTVHRAYVDPFCV